LKINESSSFTNCISASIGGAIYAAISRGLVEMSEIEFSGCEGTEGGAIHTTISEDGKMTF
jgi:hypothetical protein